jgi:hypothetical protein
MYILCTLVPKGFVVKILGKKIYLNISYEFLNLFLKENKVLDFFSQTW